MVVLGDALFRDVTQCAATVARRPARTRGARLVRRQPSRNHRDARGVRYCTVTCTVRDCDAEPPVPLAETLTVPVNEYGTAQVKLIWIVTL